MSKKYITIDGDGEVHTHIKFFFAGYVTLCGMDGDDVHRDSYQQVRPTPKGKKVDCPDCLAIWNHCKMYTKRDFVITE